MPLDKGERARHEEHSSTGRGAQLVGVSSHYAKVAGSIPSQGTYKNQLMNA